jgi:hypothetical protein
MFTLETITSTSQGMFIYCKCDIVVEIECCVIRVETVNSYAIVE